jgi:hypothetical protein
MEDGVTHKELNAALGAQTAIIIATIRRSEDRQEGEIKEVSDRVTYLERRNRWETFFASVFAFLGAVVYGKYSGG